MIDSQKNVQIQLCNISVMVDTNKRNKTELILVNQRPRNLFITPTASLFHHNPCTEEFTNFFFIYPIHCGGGPHFTKTIQ
ncbi:hypothetical protein VIGAN_02003500 [Vigna angularis var. angularis]|uniref:Uncharacterized protein n=1 Tax=Vigna angularis var. angularis TaxID=157739 RepID=A0A0S3RA16_PHAAN|nr:hypothetical protein VIGAN_02003500 [Vigna angularis var. angularis]